MTPEEVSALFGTAGVLVGSGFSTATELVKAHYAKGDRRRELALDYCSKFITQSGKVKAAILAANGAKHLKQDDAEGFHKYYVDAWLNFQKESSELMEIASHITMYGSENLSARSDRVCTLIMETWISLLKAPDTDLRGALTRLTDDLSKVEQAITNFAKMVNKSF